MPTITAYADLFRDWEGVSGACIQNATLLPKSEAIRPELDAILVQVKDLKIQQENLKGNAQATTQRLGEMVVIGRELARKLRNQIKVELGAKNEHLVQFGIAPIRKQSRKTAAVNSPAPRLRPRLPNRRPSHRLPHTPPGARHKARPRLFHPGASRVAPYLVIRRRRSESR